VDAVPPSATPSSAGPGALVPRLRVGSVRKDDPIGRARVYRQLLRLVYAAPRRLSRDEQRARARSFLDEIYAEAERLVALPRRKGVRDTERAQLEALKCAALEYKAAWSRFHAAAGELSPGIHFLPWQSDSFTLLKKLRRKPTRLDRLLLEIDMVLAWPAKTGWPEDLALDRYLLSLGRVFEAATSTPWVIAFYHRREPDIRCDTGLTKW
jgi:hypothetical protein